MSLSYIYSPFSRDLWEIRLLKILPGSRDSEVKCEAMHVSLNLHPPYEALSYAWQNEDIAVPIILNACPFLVKPNLKAALRELRGTSSDKLLWVDAICINQSDHEEKSFQVAQMKDIYKEAMTVIAWIGEESDGSARAMEFLNEMANRNRGHSYAPKWEGEKFLGNVELSWEELRSMRWGDGKSHIRKGFPILYEDDHLEFFADSRLSDWQALDALLNRAWWSRTWVVQEVWLASNAVLRCGRISLAWNSLEKALDFEDAWDDLGNSMKDTLRATEWDSLRRRYSLAIHLSSPRLLGSALSDLLWNCWDRESTDPRDKVFALFSLIGDKYSVSMKPDYSKSVEETYIDVTKEIIRCEKSLDVLLAASGSEFGKGLPSWVPNWQRSANLTRPMLFVNTEREFTMYTSNSMDSVVLDGHGFRAAGDTTPATAFGDDKGVLTAKGICVDTIDSLGNIPQATTTVEEIVNNASSIVKSTGETYITGELRSTAMQNTLFAGGRGIEQQSKEKESAIIHNVMQRRRFFVTKRGYMGVGPSALTNGHLVCIIAGCSFPLVLRQVEEDYVLVGEAYGMLQPCRTSTIIDNS
jgi:hypothetical protein